jgi:hypothetical protein
MSALLGATAAGCAESERTSHAEQTDPSLALEDGATCAPDAGDRGGSDSTCIVCPFSLGCDATNLAAEASYDEVRAKWLAECSPPGRPSNYPIVSGAACSPSGRRFLQINHGKGMERRYFDEHGAFVGVLTESDYIDPVCEGLREWPKHTSCDVQVQPETLCGSTGS